jgi:hypothetical protein
MANLSQGQLLLPVDRRPKALAKLKSIMVIPERLHEGEYAESHQDGAQLQRQDLAPDRQKVKSIMGISLCT